MCLSSIALRLCLVPSPRSGIRWLNSVQFPSVSAFDNVSRSVISPTVRISLRLENRPRGELMKGAHASNALRLKIYPERRVKGQFYIFAIMTAHSEFCPVLIGIPGSFPICFLSEKFQSFGCFRWSHCPNSFRCDKKRSWHSFPISRLAYCRINANSSRASRRGYRLALFRAGINPCSSPLSFFYGAPLSYDQFNPHLPRIILKVSVFKILPVSI